MLRRYGPCGVIDPIFDAVRWTRSNLGAVPRPIKVLVGVPGAGVGLPHARPAPAGLVGVCVRHRGNGVGRRRPDEPRHPLVEAVLIVAYALPLGLALGYGVVRLDLMLTGSRGSRARREEEASALRPEPGRWEALL